MFGLFKKKKKQSEEADNIDQNFKELDKELKKVPLNDDGSVSKEYTQKFVLGIISNLTGWIAEWLRFTDNYYIVPVISDSESINHHSNFNIIFHKAGSKLPPALEVGLMRRDQLAWSDIERLSKEQKGWLPNAKYMLVNNGVILKQNIDTYAEAVTFLDEISDDYIITTNAQKDIRIIEYKDHKIYKG